MGVVVRVRWRGFESCEHAGIVMVDALKGCSLVDRRRVEVARAGPGRLRNFEAIMGY